MAIRNGSSLPKALKERKTRFRQALVAAGLSMAGWARTHGDCTPGHLSQVLDGKRPGFALDDKIAAFTAKHLRSVA